MKTLLIISTLILSSLCLGQKTVRGVIISDTCFNEPPNHKDHLPATKIDSINILNDTTYFYITTVDECAMKSLLITPYHFIIKGDSVKLFYKRVRKDKEMQTMCSCAYKTKVGVSTKIQSKYIQVNDMILELNPCRYEGMNCTLERFNSGAIKRIIYSDKELIRVEEYYSEKGKLIEESFYEPYSGMLRKKVSHK